MIINFKKGAQIYQLLVAAIVDFFQNDHLPKWRNLLCFISFYPHEIFWWFWCLVWRFCGKGIWIWCSADNNISSWWIVLRSGSKIMLKKFNFQSDFLLSNHISATGNLWKCFSWNHHSYGCILQGVPHIICYHGLHIGLSRWPIMTLWRKMPSLTAVNVAIFLKDIPHF